jgi:hypothetical protein
MKYLQFTSEGSHAVLALPVETIQKAKQILANAEADIFKLVPEQKPITPKDHLSTIQDCICDHYVMGLEFMKGKDPHQVEGRNILVAILKRLRYTHKQIAAMIGYQSRGIDEISARHVYLERGNAAYRATYEAILEQVKKKMPI